MKQSENELDTTVNEWQAEMDKLAEGDPGKTISELVKDLGQSKWKVRKLIDELCYEGLCLRGIGSRTDSTGRQISVPVFQLVSKENK